jgi:uncharacterized protein YjbJ (UPF0337 family)
MDTTEAKVNLNEQKGLIKQKLANLTENDLLFAEGKNDEMFGKYQARIDQTKDELQKITSSL